MFEIRLDHWRTMLTTLEIQRLREDQIEVFKILKGYENIDSTIFFRN